MKYIIVLILIIICSCKRRCTGTRYDVQTAYTFVKDLDTIKIHLDYPSKEFDNLSPIPKWYSDTIKKLKLNGYTNIYFSPFNFKDIDCDDCSKIYQYGDTNRCYECRTPSCD